MPPVETRDGRRQGQNADLTYISQQRRRGAAEKAQDADGRPFFLFVLPASASVVGVWLDIEIMGGGEEALEPERWRHSKETKGVRRTLRTRPSLFRVAPLKKRLVSPAAFPNFILRIPEAAALQGWSVQSQITNTAQPPDFLLAWKTAQLREEGGWGEGGGKGPHMMCLLVFVCLFSRSLLVTFSNFEL